MGAGGRCRRAAVRCGRAGGVRHVRSRELVLGLAASCPQTCPRLDWSELGERLTACAWRGCVRASLGRWRPYQRQAGLAAPRALPDATPISTSSHTRKQTDLARSSFGPARAKPRKGQSAFDWQPSCLCAFWAVCALPIHKPLSLCPLGHYDYPVPSPLLQPSCVSALLAPCCCFLAGVAGRLPFPSSPCAVSRVLSLPLSMSFSLPPLPPLDLSTPVCVCGCLSPHHPLRRRHHCHMARIIALPAHQAAAPQARATGSVARHKKTQRWHRQQAQQAPATSARLQHKSAGAHANSKQPHRAPAQMHRTHRAQTDRPRAPAACGAGRARPYHGARRATSLGAPATNP